MKREDSLTCMDLPGGLDGCRMADRQLWGAGEEGCDGGPGLGDGLGREGVIGVGGRGEEGGKGKGLVGWGEEGGRG